MAPPSELAWFRSIVVFLRVNCEATIAPPEKPEVFLLNVLSVSVSAAAKAEIAPHRFLPDSQ